MRRGAIGSLNAPRDRLAQSACPARLFAYFPGQSVSTRLLNCREIAEPPYTNVLLLLFRVIFKIVAFCYSTRITRPEISHAVLDLMEKCPPVRRRLCAIQQSDP